MERCELLGDISEEPGVLVRPYGSRALREVNDVVSGWMQAAGMTAERDEIGNLIGCYQGEGKRPLSSDLTSTPCATPASTMGA
jgi:allantoate deiminase